MAVPEGSFWKAFVHPQSPIDEILEKENFKLEELLEHDEIIQECKYLNSGLIEYLSRPETVEKLIRYVIQPAPLPSLDEDQKQETQPARYPYVASELFACEVISMLDTLFEHPNLLALFFTFLSQKPPLDPSSAGYFRKVVVILIQRKFEQLVRFIQANNILDAMVNHIGLYSIMELLIMVGWDDSLGQVNDSKWLYEQNLVPKLVAKLDPTYEKEEDVQVNAARALVDVVVKCAPTSDSLLIRHLQHPSVLNKLFRYMFSGSRGSLTNSLSIVIVLVQREANRRNEIPPSGDPASGILELKDSVTGLPEIIAQVLKHLPELSSLLKENQDLRKALPTQFGSLSPPLGETRMKAVELFLVLFRSNYPEVNKELAALNVISYIIDLFFKFEWNNMLHGLVESIIRTILDTDSLILKQSCFIAGKLVDRVLEAYAKNAEAVKARKGCRLGYMGHVVRLCGAIAYVLDRDVKLKQQLLGEQQKEWDAFVAGPLHQDNESHNAVLAGGAPTFPPEPEEQPQSQYTPATFSSEVSRVAPTKDDDDDNDPFAFNDGEDTFSSSSSSYGLPRDEEEWNHDSSATSQFQTEEHSDSSDEEPQPNFAPADTGAGSSDDDDDDGFHTRTGKPKKKSRHPGTSPGGTPAGDGGVKEDAKSESSPVKPAGTESTAPSTASATTSTTTGVPAARNGTGDEWAAFED